jgi:hypothetical protein
LHVLYTCRAINILIFFSLLCWLLQTPRHFLFLQLKTAITLASSRDDMSTIRDALEVSAEMYRKDPNNVQDYVQRHLLSLSVWEELRYVIILLLSWISHGGIHMSRYSLMYKCCHVDCGEHVACHVIQLCFKIRGCLWLK